MYVDLMICKLPAKCPTGNCPNADKQLNFDLNSTPGSAMNLTAKTGLLASLVVCTFASKAD